VFIITSGHFLKSELSCSKILTNLYQNEAIGTKDLAERLQVPENIYP